MKTRLTLASVGTVALIAVAAPSVSAASAPPPPANSYQLTSSTYTIEKTHRQTHTGYCADNYHVYGHWTPAGPPVNAYPTPTWLQRLLTRFGVTLPKQNLPASQDLSWAAYVTPNGQWISVANTAGAGQNGTDAKGLPTYQGVSVTLYNASLIHSHNGSFTWTCVPN